MAAVTLDRSSCQLIFLSHCSFSDYSCALQKDILLQGRLYLSENWLCFYSNIFRWETTVSHTHRHTHTPDVAWLMSHLPWDKKSPSCHCLQTVVDLELWMKVKWTSWNQARLSLLLHRSQSCWKTWPQWRRRRLPNSSQTPSRSAPTLRRFVTLPFASLQSQMLNRGEIPLPKFSSTFSNL